MKWSTEDALELYKIDQWGLGYFTINRQGNLCVKPAADSLNKIDLKRLVDELRKRKINPPILIRFMDILRDRIALISDCFREAIRENNYGNQYYPLFPIKVNQERDVVTSILNYGRENGLGLEAGSKAELMIVLALTTDPDVPIVCNGYKDREFVELVGMAHKMGKKIFPVLENIGELDTFIAYYRKTGILPRLGVRVKVSTKGEGKWAKTGGEGSKFGLRIPEVVRIIEVLTQEGLLDSLKLLHFHTGSQITRIGVVKKAIVESVRIYMEMVKMGAKMEYLDIGGGLGVDYDCSGADSYSSLNYSSQEYANDVVYRVKQLCDEAGIPHPTIFSESGRFLSAHYSLLVTNVAATSSLMQEEPDLDILRAGPGPLREMLEIMETLNEDNLVECYHDALQYKTESLNLFSLGYLTLPERAAMEDLYWKIMWQIHNHIKNNNIDHGSAELDDLEDKLADTYFTNFSIFQSLPDAWAIHQIFPVAPIHRLDEYPERNGVVVDLTCDSDGLIGGYVGEGETNATLRLHKVRNDEPYYIGIFLVGAYQETLGELHNLFGDPHAVQVEITGPNRYKIHGFIKGDTIHQVIGYKSYSTSELLALMREQAEYAVERELLTLDESAMLMDTYEEGIHGYTYFED